MPTIEIPVEVLSHIDAARRIVPSVAGLSDIQIIELLLHVGLQKEGAAA